MRWEAVMHEIRIIQEEAKATQLGMIHAARVYCVCGWSVDRVTGESWDMAQLVARDQFFNHLSQIHAANPVTLRPVPQPEGTGHPLNPPMMGTGGTAVQPVIPLKVTNDN